MLLLPLLWLLTKSNYRTILTETGVQRIPDGAIITNYMDITDGQLDATLAPLTPPLRPYHEHRLLSKLMSALSVDRLKRDLTHFTTAFLNRHYQSAHGKRSAEWLYQQLKDIKSHSQATIEIEVFKHDGWPQFSLIARILPKNPTSKVSMVLSAHQDSTSSQFFPKFMPAPGADDDGSGAMLVLEVFRVMSTANLQLSHPVEFMWFAAEEAGLRGSQAVAKAYQQRGMQVRILHLDMIGYGGSNVGIITDHTSPSLSSEVRKIAEQYADCPVLDTKCGYACSDHHSWTMAGYESAAMFESLFEDMNPHIHTSQDVVEILDFEHMLRFGRIALAFLTGF